MYILYYHARACVKNFIISFVGTTEGRHDNNAVDEDKNVDFSTVEEIRLKVNQYFKKLKGIGGPRVMELFKKLNATLENPDSETKQTVCSSSSQYFIY